MKRPFIALIVATLALSGCGLFGTKHAWKQAQQENPLQIPPGMDRPATTAALTIPPPANTPVPTDTAQPAGRTAAALGVTATSMHLPGDVDTAYKRIGLALQTGDLGTVTAQDEAQHTYQLSVSSKPVIASSPSFLQKHFSNLNQQQQDNAGSSASSSSAAGEAGSVVTLRVTPAKGGGSTVRASGDSEQAARVISVLSNRLAG